MLRTYWERFKSSPFVQGVTRISAGTAAGYLAWLLISPLLTRIYTSGDFAIWGLILSYTGIFSPLLSLRYELAIVRAKEEGEARGLLVFSILITLALSILIVLMLMLLSRARLLGLELLRQKEVYPVFFLILLGAGMYTALRFYSVRKHEFSRIGLSSAFQQVARGGGALLMGLAKIPYGLLLGEVAGRFAAILVFFLRAKFFSSLRDLFPRFSLLVQYREFSLLFTLSTILDSLGANLLLPVYHHFYGATISGQIALAQRILVIPLSLLGAGIADVFHSQIGSDFHEEKYDELFSRTHRTARRLLLLGALPALGLMVFGPTLFPLVFGEQWRVAGTILGLLASWQWVQFVASPLSRVFAVVGRIHWKLLFDAISLVIITGLPFLSFLLGASAETSLAWLGVCELLLYIFYLFLILGVARKAPSPEPSQREMDELI